MKPYQVQYNLEQYIPEYKQLLKDNIFTQQQISQISQQREQFERKILETFTPQLNDAIQYCDHLVASRKLIQQRYKQLQIQQTQQQFSYHKQYLRIAKYIINSNKYNLSVYCYFLNLAQKINDQNLLVQVAQMFKAFHGYYYLPYIFLAYNSLKGNGINDCRRHLSDGDKQIRKYQINYYEYNSNVKFTTQCIGEVDQIIQQPKDISIYYANWYHIENEYKKQLLGEQIEEIEENSEQEDDQIKLYQNNFYQSYVFCRLMNKIQEWDYIQSNNIQKILDSEIMQYFINMIGDQLTEQIVKNGIIQYIKEKQIKVTDTQKYNISNNIIEIQPNQLNTQGLDNQIRKQQNE